MAGTSPAMTSQCTLPLALPQRIIPLRFKRDWNIPVRRLAATVGIFMLAGLMGPVLQWISRPLISMDLSGEGGAWLKLLVLFIVRCTWMVWPTWPFGVIEYSVGALVAIIVVVGGNVLLFGLMGLVAGLVSRWTLALIVVYLMVAGLLCWWHLIGRGLGQEGFSIWQIDPPSLLTALAFYAFLFWVAARHHHHA